MVMNEEEDDDDSNTDDEDKAARDFYMLIDHDFEIMVTKSFWIKQLSLQSIFEFLS